MSILLINFVLPMLKNILYLVRIRRKIDVSCTIFVYMKRQKFLYWTVIVALITLYITVYLYSLYRYFVNSLVCKNGVYVLS